MCAYRFIAVASLSCVAGCDRPAPPVAAPPSPPPPSTVAPAVSTAPTAVASAPAPAASAPAPSSGVDLDAPLPKPPPDADVPSKIPNGVVAADLLESLADADVEVQPPFSNAEACVQRIAATSDAVPPGCAWEKPSILAFHAKEGRVAFLDSKTADNRDGCDDAVSVITTFGAGKQASEVKPLPRKKTEGCPGGTTMPDAVAQLVLRLSQDGYQQAPNLVKKRAFQIFGAWGYTPVAVLRAPLRGFMVQALADRANTKVIVRLVSPDNRTSVDLASVPLKTVTCLDRTEKGCRKSTTWQAASVAQVALSPDAKTLAMLVKLNTPEGHDTADSFTRLVVALPEMASGKPRLFLREPALAELGEHQLGHALQRLEHTGADVGDGLVIGHAARVQRLAQVIDRQNVR